MGKLSSENIIKGRIGEAIAEEMFKEMGFFVMKLGKEHTANPLDQIRSFVHKCGGKFELEKLGMEIREITHINVLPDFIIVCPTNGKVQLVEVKYRFNADLYDGDLMVFKTYPEAHMMVINSEVYGKINEINEKESPAKEGLLGSRFHIWTKRGSENNDKIRGRIIGFKEWLKEDFDLILDEDILKKYERLVSYWLREDRGKIDENVKKEL